MLNWCYLFLVVFGSAGQNALRKLYSQKVGHIQCAAHVFNVVTAACTLLAFLVLGVKNFQVHLQTIGYALLFALGFLASILFSILAMREGTLALTALVVSYSLLVPALYGLLFLHERFTIAIGIGILLLMLSLYFINYSPVTCQITGKWVLLATLAFLGTGLCATAQKMHQVAFPGAYQHEFMIVGMATALAVNLLVLLLSDTTALIVTIRQSLLYAVPTGLFNALVNGLVLVLATTMSASVVYPFVAAGTVVLTLIFSRVLFREVLSKPQLLGVIMGCVSIVCLCL